MRYNSMVEQLRSIIRVTSPIAVLAAIAVLVLFTVATSRIIGFFKGDAPPAYASAAIEEGSGHVGADWQQEMTLLGLATTSDPTATSTGDSIALIGPAVMAQLLGAYAGLEASGTSGSDTLAEAAHAIAPHVKAIVTHRLYGTADIKVDADTSLDRMLAYRADMREALAPLLDNKQSELEMYGRFVETNDKTILTDMKSAAANYRAAASLALAAAR